MRQTLIAIIGSMRIALVATTAIAERRAVPEDTKTARADVGLVPPSAMRSTAGTSAPARNIYDVRESASLVLVGGMLLGLAAAVRRTV